MYHVNYLCAKARQDRWREEKVNLESEMSCTHRYFLYMAEAWKLRGSGLPDRNGRDCYAYKQACNWGQLATYVELGIATVIKLELQ